MINTSETFDFMIHNYSALIKQIPHFNEIFIHLVKNNDEYNGHLKEFFANPSNVASIFEPPMIKIYFPHLTWEGINLKILRANWELPLYVDKDNIDKVCDDYYRYLPLMARKASSNGNLSLVKMAIDTGSNIPPNELLIAACSSAQIDIVKWLVRQCRVFYQRNTRLIKNAFIFVLTMIHLLN